MKKPINEIAKLKRLAGLITESEYQEEMMNTEAKSSVSKEDKIQVIKEWIWFTCDEGQAKDDINKYNKMIDMYFASKDDVTKEDFKNLWNKVSEVWGVGDVGADSEGFPETWRDVQRGKLVNPSMKYEGKESLMNETMYYVHDEEGMEEPIGPFTIDQAKQELVKQGAGWKMIDAATAKQIWSYLEDDMNEAKEKVEGLNKAFGGINENSYLMAKNPDVKAKVDKIIELLF